MPKYSYSTAMQRWQCTIIIFVLMTAGCGEDKTAPIDIPPRAIKYITIKEDVNASTRRFAGVVQAGTNSNVAFEVGGRVVVMAKNIGDVVTKGELLARLDTKPIELQVQQAEFTLSQAKATLNDTKSKLSQQEQLWKKRYSTKTAYDTAKANYSNAEGQVGIAHSQLNLRKRDLEKATLTAPFSGRVSKRQVEVFEEVQTGQAIYTLQSQGDNEVVVSIPETLINTVKLGDKVDVTFPPLDNASTSGLVTEVSPIVGDGNAFPVTVRLETSPNELRSGMTADIEISVKTQQNSQAFSIPVGAIKPDVTANQGTVFIYDPKTKTVSQRAIKVVGVEGNDTRVIGEINSGDIVATAGVGQMYDGMQVRLLDTRTPF